MPSRPSFQLAGTASGTDLDLPFNGGALASMQIEPTAILDATVAPLHPDSSAALTLAGCLEDQFGTTQRRRLALARWEIQLQDRHMTLLSVNALTVDPPPPVVYERVRRNV